MLHSLVLRHEVGDEGLGPIDDGLLDGGLLLEKAGLVRIELGLLVAEELLLGLEGGDLGLGFFLGQMMAEAAVGAVLIIIFGIVLEMFQFLFDGVHFALDMIELGPKLGAFSGSLVQHLLLLAGRPHGMITGDLGRLVFHHLLRDDVHGDLLLLEHRLLLLLVGLLGLQLGDLVGQGGVLRLEVGLGTVQLGDLGVDVRLELVLQCLEALEPSVLAGVGGGRLVGRVAELGEDPATFLSIVVVREPTVLLRCLLELPAHLLDGPKFFGKGIAVDHQGVGYRPDYYALLFVAFVFFVIATPGAIIARLLHNTCSSIFVFTYWCHRLIYASAVN
mmetsp:Transcript_23570/g.67887  ORF Transcript_23570/g.67887 Transcript_23570/m.67887 type:complete len:332 (-) Transcript_23570:172-1167(-)